MKQCPFCDDNLPEDSCDLQTIKVGTPNKAIEDAPVFSLRVINPKDQTQVFLRRIILTIDK